MFWGWYNPSKQVYLTRNLFWHWINWREASDYEASILLVQIWEMILLWMQQFSWQLLHLRSQLRCVTLDLALGWPISLLTSQLPDCGQCCQSLVPVLQCCLKSFLEALPKMCFSRSFNGSTSTSSIPFLTKITREVSIFCKWTLNWYRKIELRANMDGKKGQTAKGQLFLKYRKEKKMDTDADILR